MPGTVGINFNGAYVVRPGVYSKIDVSAMVPSSTGASNNVGCIGMSDGGVPGTVYSFSSYTDAASVLRQGPALSYLSRIFNPTSDDSLQGASTVLFQRLAPAATPPAQSTLTAAGLTFTSADYGRHTNGISVAIVAGSTFGTWAVTIAKAADGYSRTYTVGQALSVSSTATAPQVVFDHVNRECNLYSGTTLVGQLAYPDTSVTVTNLVAFINSFSGWTATITGDASMPLCYMDNPAMGTTGSTTSDATDDSTVVGATAIPLYAAQGQLVYQLASDPQVSAALTTGTTYGPLAAVATVNLTGGAGTGQDAYAASDFVSPLANFEVQNIQHLFLCTSLAAAHALGYQHVLTMRTTKRKRWRILYAGGPVGQTVAQAILQAQALGGPVVYPWNGTYAANPITGVAENLGGIGAAAQMCGLAAGTSEATSLTYKMLIASALENPSPADSDIEALLVGGVCPIVYNPEFGDPIIEQAITTYQGGANVAYRKLQGLRIQDAISRGFQSILVKYVGSTLDLIAGQRIKAAVAKFLDSEINTANNSDGYLTQGYSNSKVTPAWENLTVSTDGLQTWTIQVTTHPVGESAYLLVEVSETAATIEV